MAHTKLGEMVTVKVDVETLLSINVDITLKLSTYYKFCCFFFGVIVPIICRTLGDRIQKLPSNKIVEQNLS